MQCDYFDAGLCHSCTWLATPYARQLAEKDERARAALAPYVVSGAADEPVWREPIASAESAFRNKAKMVVGGTVADPALGILREGHRSQVQDLRECGLYEEPIAHALPRLAEFITTAKLTPYDIATRRGELKYVLVTASPAGELMVRFVLRSTEAVSRIRKHLGELQRALPHARVVSVNIQPKPAAIIEGEEEIVLTESDSLAMDLGHVTLHLGTRSFFQTNTSVARALYRQAQDWVRSLAGEAGEAGASGADGASGEAAATRAAEAAGAKRATGAEGVAGDAGAVEPAGAKPARLREIWDLYCGVGGFALHLGGPGRRARGIEISAAAIEAAKRSAEAIEAAKHSAAEAAQQGSWEFIAGDATQFALEQPTGTGLPPDLVVVNPPRRGIGSALAGWLEATDIPYVLYSSCNVDSLARDLAAMPSLRVVRAQVLDMFPQTAHFETLTLLQRRPR